MELSRDDLHSLAAYHKGLVWSLIFFAMSGLIMSMLEERSVPFLAVGFFGTIALCLQSRYLYRISKILKYKYITLISLSCIILPYIYPAYFAFDTGSVLNRNGMKVGFFGSDKVNLYEDFLRWRRTK